MGGSAARLGQFPWVAYLSVRGPDIDKMCAGTLIADRSARQCDKSESSSKSVTCQDS